MALATLSNHRALIKTKKNMVSTREIILILIKTTFTDRVVHDHENFKAFEKSEVICNLITRKNAKLNRKSIIVFE